MKKILYLLALLMISICVFAQEKRKYVSDEYGNPMHYDISNPWSRKALILMVDGGAKKVIPFKKYGSDYSNFGNFVYLEKATFIELESIIHRDSLKYYRYDIVENDSTYLVNQAIPEKIKFVWNSKSDYPNYFTIDLGKFNVVNKKIEVKVYKGAKKQRQISQAIIYNKLLERASIIYQTIYSKEIGKKNLIGKPFKSGDTIIVNGKTKMLSIAIKDTKVNFLYDVTITNENNKSTSSYLGQFKFDGKDKATTNINASSFTAAGNYKLTITPRIGNMFEPGHFGDSFETTIKFTIVKADAKLFSTKEIVLTLLVFLAVGGTILVGVVTYIKRKNQKKLASAQQQRELSKTQLNSIRSQLNPHFMFNALAGIQNLMNTNRIDEANRYLGKFSRLTRNVLDGKELISLAEEKNLIEDYLQMEQFRFGFSYEIIIDKDLNVDNIEIPTMLLQPFVENAVKHGIAEMGAEGKINASFIKEDQHLILKVADNGKGFETTQNYTGLGLQLSKNRISLLNTIYPETTFIITMKSSVQGAVITLTINQWL